MRHISQLKNDRIEDIFNDYCEGEKLTVGVAEIDRKKW